MIKCRACLITETNMIPMDMSFINNFNMLTGLNITKTNNLLYTCKKCSDAVNFYIDFRNRCIESDIRLQEVLISVPIQEIKYVNEPLQDKKNCGTLVKLELCNNSIICESQNIHNDESYAYVTPYSKGLIFDTEIVKDKRKKVCFKKSKTKVKCTDSKIHCGLCDSKLDDKTELTKHLEYHKSIYNAQVSCGLCTEKFLNLPHMLGHRLEHIPEDQRNCHLCSKRFMASSSTCLEFHYMRVHGMAHKDAPIQCKQCPSSYITSRKLIRHVRDCHSAPRYECRPCNRGFRNKTLLNVHNKMKHTEEKQFSCQICEFTSKYQNSLKLHTRRKHTPNTFNCKACYRVFLDESSLSRHVADVCKHHTRVVCPVCGHTVKKVWLKHHMRSHSDEYPFKCDSCPAQYKYRTGLKDHTDKHKGDMTFHCDLCSKSFCIKSALQSHRRTHAGEKPFVCDICKAGFKRRYNLKAHMNAHPWSMNEEKKNS